MTEDEMVGWHHRLNGHEFEKAPGVGDGQGGLVLECGEAFVGMCTSSKHGIYVPIYQASCEWCVCRDGGVGVW